MRKIVLLIAIACQAKSCFSQFKKEAVDTGSFGAWGWKVDGGILSGDGKYFACRIDSFGKASVAELKSVNGNWQKALTGVTRYEFLSSGHNFIFQKHDSLFTLTGGTNKVRLISTASLFSVIKNIKGEWVVYQTAINGKNRLVVTKANSKPIFTIDSILYSQFNVSNDLLLYQKEANRNGKAVSQVFLKYFSGEQDELIWTGDMNNSGSVVFDNKNNQLLLKISDENRDTKLYLYSMQTRVTKTILPKYDPYSGYKIDLNTATFTIDGTHLICSLTEKQLDKTKGPGAEVDLWSYRDEWLQETELKRTQETLHAAINITTGKVTALEDSVFSGSINLYSPGNYVVQFKDTRGEQFEGNNYWREGLTPTAYLYSIKSGERIFITNVNTSPLSFIGVSPGEKYVIFYNCDDGRVYSYETATGKRRQIDWNNSLRIELKGWLEEDKAFLASDGWDLWQIDPLAEKESINATAGYAKAQHLKLNMAKGPDFIYHAHEDILYYAFDTATKYGGYYQFKFNAGKAGVMTKLTMCPYTYGIIREANGNYLVKRESTSEAPNYYFTSDWKNLKPLTKIEPHKNFNWIKSELITWKQPDGTLGQGALYTPENFDSTKKYPLIVQQYRQRTDNIYKYEDPALSTGAEINIPYFVSRGYVIFEPDFHQRIDHAGESILETIESGLAILSTRSWYDKNKIGITGHSWGGGQTNYIITHSKIFAAASEGAGASNFISQYGELYDSYSNQDRTVTTDGLSGNIWQDLPAYLNNSAILNADKVSTPLLILHNKKDFAVAWTQGVQFFTALRRNNKMVWMLQYDNGDHTIFNKDALDYTLRVEQFFDHYLKGLPPPKWMTQGIPAQLKTIENRYEMDPQGNCGPKCKICMSKKY